MLFSVKRLKKILVFVLASAILYLQFQIPAFSAGKKEDSVKTVISVSDSETSYAKYYDENSNKPKPKKNINIAPSTNNAEYSGKKTILLGKNKEGFAETFKVEEAGIYHLRINYETLKSDNSPIRVTLHIDGALPFDEAERMELTRVYEDGISNEFEKDKFGNDVRPTSKEVFCEQSASFADLNSLYPEPYIFKLSEGEHSVKLNSETEIAVISIEFYNDNDIISYNDYIKSHKKTSRETAVRQEAEFIYRKNADTIYPTYEKADASTLPIKPDAILLNTIGQNNWNTQGQYITWKADIKTEGLYSISFRANQRYNENGASYRRLYINGKVPFKEANLIEFKYSVNWYVKTLGDDKPYYVYLKPGDEITLECNAETTCDVSRNISRCLSELSSIYREIFVITGSNPDMYTDYNLDVKIPTLIKELKTVKKDLSDTIDMIVKTTGRKNSNASTLSEILETVQTMIDKPYDIHRHLTDLSDDITNIGSLVMSIGQQPLELDCFFFTPCDQKTPSGSVSFKNKVKYWLERFFYSYTSDYTSFEGNHLKVWVSTGRDQLQIMQRMIEEKFESQYDTKVDLSLVDTGQTLIKATISGKGPDVALNIGSDTPINLAIRGALVDLKNYNVQELSDRFHQSAWTPFMYKDSIYAIPETQVFNVMFYRKDVFDLLEIEPPKTWDEFFSVLEILQRNNFEIGIPEIGANAGVSDGIATFSRFLLQNGGSYYSEDYKTTAFDTDQAYDAFTKWVNLYKKYSLDRSFNFFNRFRTGVMALSFQPYSTYNQLYSSAPEIRGLWKMAPVPGTMTDDGKIDHSETSAGTGCIMLKSAEKKGLGKDAFDFMSWWTSDETQANYASELESTMGIAARYTPANIEAFKRIKWSSDESEVLQQQRSEIKNFREIPGNYVLPRSLTSAFRKALVTNDLPERQLELYNKAINEELARKAKEFDLFAEEEGK